MSLPSVYIILLNWNDADNTAECIRSLEKMTYPNYHIVVVDNASEDESDKIIEKSFPDITLLRSSENVGFTGGNNIGIRHALAKGADYIWILNNDTTVEPDALGFMVKRLREDPASGVVGCTILNTDTRRSVQLHGGGFVRYLTAQHRNNIKEKVKLDYISGCSMLVRCEILDKYGCFDERIFMTWEDVELSHRIQKLGYTIGWVPEARIYHKGSASMEPESPRREYYYSQGTVIFFKTHVPYWPLSIAIAYMGKVVRRLFRGEFANIQAVTKGFRDGILDKPPRFED